MNVGSSQINQIGSVVRFDTTRSKSTDKRLHFQKLNNNLTNFAKTKLKFNEAPPNKDQTSLGEHMKTIVKESGVGINLDGADTDIDILTKIGQHIHDSLQNGRTLTKEESTLNDDMYLLIKLAHKCEHGSSIFEGMNRDRYSFDATGNKVGIRSEGKPNTAWASFFKDCKVCNDLHTSPTADKGLTYVGEKVPDEKIRELIDAIAGKSANSDGSITG
ncbi:MAG: hypothetical protein VXX85_05920, partial [Candidatus Margulisiibacteriota bacterium]|nr:hypothetical protein [Candidatus Margulisiibacteriota bacterium]